MTLTRTHADLRLVIQDIIGDIDVVLVSNSYWIGEDWPCLTFGLRGVIHATLKVQSSRENLHSGIWGGATSEPLTDLVRVIASLTAPDGSVQIPGFLADVRKLTSQEKLLYETIVQRCQGFVWMLFRRVEPTDSLATLTEPTRSRS